MKCKKMFVLAIVVFFGVMATWGQVVVGSLINFDDQPVGAIVYEQYRSAGVIFSSVDFDFVSFTTSPVFNGVVVSNHWPTSAPRSIEPTRTGVFKHAPFPNFPALQMEFVLPGNDIPATTDYVHLFSDAAINDGGGANPVIMLGFGLDGSLLDSSSGDDNVPNLLLSVSHEGIHKVVVVLGQYGGLDIETYDNVYFNTPIPEPASAVMLGLGGFFLVLRRRRRQA